jgi:hypothetical protein
MRRTFLISYFLFLISYFYHPYSCFSQAEQCHLRISLLTATPGEELYSTFGHSALRVTDSVNNQDIVYNYGTFNFEEPGFYKKFVLGKLLYYLSTEDFNSFARSYEYEKRGITEQVLNLSCSEKLKMFQLLQKNLEGDNKYYKYDFLFDNCTTRLRDLLEKAADTTVRFSKLLKEKTTFRQLIHTYLDKGDKLWSKLGIDMFLGAKTDAVMDDREVMFLPDYLLMGFDSGRIAARPVVTSKNEVINYTGIGNSKNSFLSPLFIFSLLFAIILWLSISKKNAAKRFLAGFDGFIFFIVGFIGLAMIFMWFCTDHIMTKNNYNLLWALPTHAVAAFFVNSNKNWPKFYFTLTVILHLLVLLVWFFLPQQLNPGFIPIVLILILRSLAHARQPSYLE